MPASPSIAGCGSAALMELCEAANLPQSSESQKKTTVQTTPHDQSLVAFVGEYQQLVERNRVEELELLSSHRKEEAQCYERIHHFRQNAQDETTCTRPEPQDNVMEKEECKEPQYQPMPDAPAREIVIIDLGSDSEEEDHKPSQVLDTKTDEQEEQSQRPQPVVGAWKNDLRRPQHQSAWWSTSEQDWNGMPMERKKTTSLVGWIMETDVGRDAPQACSHCERRGYKCRILAVPLLWKGKTFRPRICAFCHTRGRGKSCSLVHLPYPQDDLRMLPALEMPDVSSPSKGAGGGNRITELTTSLSTPPNDGCAELMTLTDMFEVEKPKEEESNETDYIRMPKRRPTAIANSRSSNAKKLRRASFIDLTQ